MNFNRQRLKRLFSCIVLAAMVLTTLQACRSSNDEKNEEIITPPHTTLKAMLSFKFLASNNPDLTSDATGVIDEEAKTVHVMVPQGTIVTNLLPDIEISQGAKLSPTGAQNFTDPFRYSITAEDQSVADYVVTVTHAASAENKIVGFQFLKSNNNMLMESVIAGIDQTKMIIVATVPVGTDITNLLPTVNVSAGASATPAGAQDFTQPVTYTVTAQNGEKAAYEVSVVPAVSNRERDALVAIYSASPNNTLAWDLRELDISNWEGVTTDLNGKVTKLVMTDVGLSTIPPEIQWLTALTELDVSFNSLTAIPKEIKSLVKLKWFKMRANRLTALPDEIGTITSLTYLNMESNLITEVPAVYGKLVNLTDLQLHHNRIVSVSSEIKKLKKLKYLVMSGNQITSLPAEIGQLTSLINLNLSYNLLTTLPREVGQITTLTGIHIESNKLTSLPAEIAQLPKLKYIYLNINTELPAIPQAICDMVAYGVNVLKDDHVTCN